MRHVGRQDIARRLAGELDGAQADLASIGRIGVVENDVVVILNANGEQPLGSTVPHMSVRGDARLSGCGRHREMHDLLTVIDDRVG
jgi:hypothetical protein